MRFIHRFILLSLHFIIVKTQMYFCNDIILKCNILYNLFTNYNCNLL